MLSLIIAQTIASKSWTLVCGGDMMLNGVSANVPVFRNLNIPSDAIFYANLEIPLTNTKERTSRKTAEELRNRDQYILKADPKHIKNIKESGLDVVSLANNHAMDGGASGLNQMLKLLDREKVPYCGAGNNWAEAIKPSILVAPDGTRVAFISYLSFLNKISLRKCHPATTNGPGIAALTLSGAKGPKEVALVEGIVRKSKANADVLIVCLHWGVEKAPLPSQYQVDMARMFIGAGADAIVGAHPHVLQPSELYKGKPILYSLGNLVNSRSGNTALYSLRFQGSNLVDAKAENWVYRGGQMRKTQQFPLRFCELETSLERKYQSKGLIKAFIKTNLKPAK